MKRIGWIIALVAVGAIAGTAGAVYQVWRQTTRLPEWYAAQSGFTDLSDADFESAEARVMRRAVVLQDGSVEAELTGEDVQELVAGAIAEDQTAREWVERTRGFNTTVSDGTLRTGVVLNVGDLPTDQLGDNERGWLERAIALFPALEDQTIYIGVEGQPRVEDGLLRLDDTMFVTIGDMRMSLPDMASRFGIDLETLEREINLNLELSGVDINDVEVVGDRIIVRGEPL